jgi:hypothetical protein
MFVAAGTFNYMAIKYFTNQSISWAFDNYSRLSQRAFKSLFLYSDENVADLWSILDTKAFLESRGNKLPFQPHHLLWTLYYLKVYPTWDQMALTTGITEKTLRKWVDIVVQHLAAIDDFVSTRTLLFHAFAPTSQISHCHYQPLLRRATDRMGESFAF